MKLHFPSAVCLIGVSLVSISALAASNSEYEVKGPSATAIIKALQACGVTSVGGEESLSIETRSVTCDVQNNNEYTPPKLVKAFCTILNIEFLGEPTLCRDSEKADALADALSKGLQNSNLNYADCAMGGRCSVVVNFIDCESSSVSGVSCRISAQP